MKGEAVMATVEIPQSDGARAAGPVLARRVIAAAQVLAECDGMPATVLDERRRAVLEAFPGWGPVAALFDADPGEPWAELADELDDAAGDAMGQAARVVDTSFFSPPELVAHIWNVLCTAGFTGGSVLDLGCGTGAFIRHAPCDLVVESTGVEADPTSARIARLLLPGANIITGELQKVSLPHKRFDAAVGNVPFSAARVHDGAIGFYGPLHEYFVARAVAAVRPGGYVVVVTSRHELDAANGLSSSITKHADLMAAVRLPSGYFRESGTDVVADVLVLRVRDGDDDGHGWSHVRAGVVRTAVESTVRGRACREMVSPFWGLHPELVAGDMVLTGFDRSPLAVRAANPGGAVASAFAAVGPLLVPYTDEAGLSGDLDDVRLTDDQGRKEGSLHSVDGQVVRIVDGALTAVARPSAELRALIGLRDAAVALIEAESDWDTPDSALEPLRVACRQEYQKYVDRYGALNRGTMTEGKPDPETGLPRLGYL